MDSFASVNPRALRRQTPKLIFLGRTYPKHAAELGNAIPPQPIFFLKSPSSMIGPGEPIVCPSVSDEVHHEAEVAVWIGSTLRNASDDEVKASIRGWTILNDITARDVQRREQGRFSWAKNFDTFCPISPEWVDRLSWRQARIQCLVNGQIRQNEMLEAMTHTPWALIRYVSCQMTLHPGDLVSLGTPSGVGIIKPGDTVEVRLLDSENRPLIRLENPVI